MGVDPISTVNTPDDDASLLLFPCLQLAVRVALAAHAAVVLVARERPLPDDDDADAPDEEEERARRCCKYSLRATRTREANT